MNKIFTFFLKISNHLGKIILTIIGIICIWYFIKITAFLGYLNVFNLIWIFIGILFIIIAFSKRNLLKLLNKKHKVVKIFCLIFVIIFSLSFIVVEVLIITNAKTNHSEDADYLILLGAGLNKDKPSLTLLRRIETALSYSRNNSTVRIVASGGKSGNEKFSEAEIIAKVLQDNDINYNRIIIENRSRSTYENLKYSGELIESFNKKIVIVSSEFHLYRAECIARKLGYNNIGTLASKTPLILIPNYYVREYFVLIKEILTGNI